MQSQSGIALPVAVLVLGIVLLLTGIALSSAVRSNQQTNQDRRVKAALQAANGGADLAQARMGLLKASLLPTTPCISLNASGVAQAVQSLTGSLVSTLGSLVTGMCSPVTDTYPNGATSTYTVVTYNPNGGGLLTNLLGTVFGSLLNVQRTIISQGSYQGVTRRVAVDVKLTAQQTQTFGNYAVSSLNSVALSNGTTRYASMRTNGSITATSGSNTIGDFDSNGNCRTTTGDATPGPTGSVSLPTSQGNKVCGSTAKASQAFSLPPYDATGAASSNDNGRITNCNGTLVDLGLTDWCPWPGYSGPWEWNASTRILKTNYNAWYLGLGNYAPLTVRGATYYLCRLELQGGSHIRVPAGVNVRFVIDKAACPAGTSNPGQFVMENASAIISGGGLAANVQIYVVGGGDVKLRTDSSQLSPFTVYAPDSTVYFGGNMQMVGAIAAKSFVEGGGGMSLKMDGSVAGIGSTGASSYQASNFRECLVRTNPTGPLDGCTAPSN